MHTIRVSQIITRLTYTAKLLRDFWNKLIEVRPILGHFSDTCMTSPPMCLRNGFLASIPKSYSTYAAALSVSLIRLSSNMYRRMSTAGESPCFCSPELGF